MALADAQACGTHLRSLLQALPAGARPINGAEKWWFWVVLCGNVAAWALLALLAFISFKWEYMLIPIIGVILGGSNCVGYFKCSGEARKELNDMSTRLISGAMSQGLQAGARLYQAPTAQPNTAPPPSSGGGGYNAV